MSLEIVCGFCKEKFLCNPQKSPNKKEILEFALIKAKDTVLDVAIKWHQANPEVQDRCLTSALHRAVENYIKWEELL